MTSILIVDDSKTARMMLKHWLRDLLPAAEIVEAESGEEGLLRLAEIGDKCQMAVVDYNMNGMTGLDFVQQIIDRLEPSRILLCTANIQDVIRERAASLGVRFIPKPVTPVKIKHVLSEMNL